MVLSAFGLDRGTAGKEGALLQRKSACSYGDDLRAQDCVLGANMASVFARQSIPTH